MTPATELEAVNEMLGAVGQAPVAALSGTLPTDVQLARTLLTGALRETLTKGWRFNTEFGVEIAPAGTLEWVSIDTETLNVFTPPANLASFKITPVAFQQGARYVDAVIRPASVFRVADVAPLVFYDRVFNRDGWSGREYLYIDPVWLFDFAEVPQVARTYVTVLASRRYQQRVAGSPDLAGITMVDERDALRELHRLEATKDDYNIFHNHSVARVMGHRPFGGGGGGDWRASYGRRLP